MKIKNLIINALKGVLYFILYILFMFIVIIISDQFTTKGGDLLLDICKDTYNVECKLEAKPIYELE